MLKNTLHAKMSGWATSFISAIGLGLFGLLPATASQQAELVWKPSTNRNVTGYHIYYGPASRTYTNSSLFGNVTKGTISGLVDGATYYFSAKSRDAHGSESDFSNQASYEVPAKVLPTLNPIASLTLPFGTPSLSISLTGISSGAASQNQAVRITTSSNNRSLIANPSISYNRITGTGSLTFKPAANKSGSATITVIVNGGGGNNNLISQSFVVTVLPWKNSHPIVAGKSKLMNGVATTYTSADASAAASVSSQLLALKPSQRQFSLMRLNPFWKSAQPPQKSEALASSTHTLAAISGAGVFAFQVTGVSSNAYVVQATEDLIHWFPVQTNKGIFIFTDTNAAAVPRRFYRTFQLGI